MTNEELLDIAATWSFWDRPVPSSIRRDVPWPRELRPTLALVIQGVRRCGKSTLMQQAIERFDLDRRDCAFLNCEDPRLANALAWETLQQLVDAFVEVRPGRDLVFFVDEIQNVEGWERWLRARLDDRGTHRFVVTGSNATMLSGELSSALTGRHLQLELYPFSWLERRRAEGALSLEDYLQRGGFPEPLQLDARDGDRLLQQYFTDIVERDVRERSGARSAQAVRKVVQMALESVGSEVSTRRIAGATGVAVETAGSYLDACEDAYLLFGVPYFAHSERKRAVRNRKYYAVDTALRRVSVTATGADRGKMLESVVHLTLRRRFGEVFYWRDGGEVDFVVNDGGRVVPIQVTWDEPKPRHHAALEAFYESHPYAAEAEVVTAERFDGWVREVAGE